jgi:hypothetical protein
VSTPSEFLIDRCDRLLFAVSAPIVRRFVVLDVDSPKEVLARTSRLRKIGFRTSLDIMVEDIQGLEMVERVCATYLELVQLMNTADSGNIVIKPTSLGLDLADTHSGEKMFREMLLKILCLVEKKNKTLLASPIEVEIDAESTRTIATAFKVIADLLEVQPQYSHLLRIALPMHIKDLPIHTSTYRLFDHPIRIVKGAGVYNEDPSKLVDEQTVIERYRQHFYRSLRSNSFPFIATMRDGSLIRTLANDAESMGYTKGEYVIQMLYGLWTGLGKRLLADQHEVCIYVPITFPWSRGASDGYVRRRVRMFRSLLWNWIFGRHRNSK